LLYKNKTMEKQTKILLGVGAAILAILILNSKKVDSANNAQPLETGGGGAMPMPNLGSGDGGAISSGEDGGAISGGGVGVLENPVGDSHPPALPLVERTTKDCVQVGYDCTKNIYNTIQIPLDADCNDYQPAMPQCAGPRGGGDMMMVAPMVAPTESLNFV